MGDNDHWDGALLGHMDMLCGIYVKLHITMMPNTETLGIVVSEKIFFFHIFPIVKNTSRQRSGKGAIRKKFPLQKPRREKTILTIRFLYHGKHFVSRMNSYFPNRWPLSYINLTKI